MSRFKTSADYTEDATIQTLVGHLLEMHEAERIVVARQLHDDMGSSLVSAIMDLAWAEQHLDFGAAMLSERLQRVRANLRSAIDLNRAMTEQLRPTLLDNFGLFAACRWHFKRIAAGLKIGGTERYPAEELPLTGEARTNLFRIVQELLGLVADSPQIGSIDLVMATTETALRICIAYTASETLNALQTNDTRLATILHRVIAVRGQLESVDSEGGVRYELSVPIRTILE